jgi:UDP-N-acetylmuramate dehydrogenase
MDIGARLEKAFGAEHVLREAPLAPLTTFKVGGPAEWLVDVHSSGEVEQAITIAKDAGVPLTVLGGGSNVLVADGGLRGIVMRMHGGEIRALGPSLIRADAGVTINGLVRWTVSRGVAGVEAWAGTPGTVGGAIFGNAHFNGRLIGELIARVRLVTAGGTLADVRSSEMEFGYDFSRLHRTREVVVSADFHVSPGEPGALRTVARESLAFRKRTQPLESPSAGCIFQNPDPARDHVPEGIPPSAGALVDRAGLKGARQGAARVSTSHANFIINEGGATARDIRTLIDRCKAEVHTRFGVMLREEIVYLGEWI